VFGRTKTPQPQATTTAPTTKAAGKGRPTPSRKEAEARNRKPIVGATAVRPGASKEERKAAKAAQREAFAAERAKTRQALVSGDERNLPERDRGPARRFTRDYVDARWNLGEFLLPVALVTLALGMVNAPVLKLGSVALLYGMAFAVVMDVLWLRRKVRRVVTEKFGAGAPGAAGIAGYAMMRSLQFRRARLPRPQTKRGQWPH
jgi:hypothetical protein